MTISKIRGRRESAETYESCNGNGPYFWNKRGAANLGPEDANSARFITRVITPIKVEGQCLCQSVRFELAEILVTYFDN